MSTPIETVQAIYEAFGRGDIPAILERLADDVAWESWTDNAAQRAGVPWMAPRNRREEVPGFFQTIGAFQFHAFQILSLMAGGNQVAAEIAMDVTLPGGGRHQDEEIHLWTFNDAGKVTRFRHYLDTAKHIRAAGLG